MRQHILATALAAAVTALAYGQNLNPTVEVTNAYESGAAAIAKPAQQMAVPDSVTRFNLDFDYSVFEKPYQGAYEFSPYYVQLKPAPKVSTTEKFYLRAGAGFTLHPELDLVWTPIQQEKYRLNVYATHHSYFGRYHKMQSAYQDNVVTFEKSGEKVNGYLADTKAGVDGAYGWDGGVATLDIGYRQRMADNAYHYQKMGGIEAKGRVRSLPSDEPHFLYDAAVKYHFMNSDLSHMDRFTQDISESAFNLDGTFGPVLDENHRFLVDMDLDLARYRGDKTGYTGLLSATPKYQFEADRWRLSLGVKVAAIIYSDEFDLWEEAYRHKSGTVFPDVHVDYHLLDDRLILQASATGGDRFNSFSGRFFSRPFTYDGAFGHSTERIRAMIGARGNIASRFRYDFQAGYARWAHAAMDGFFLGDYTVSGGILPVLPAQYEQSFNLAFAELDYGWKSESVTVDGKMAYRWTNIKECLDDGGVFAPAAFTGFIRPAYNWGDRFKVGLDAEWSTARRLGIAADGTLIMTGSNIGYRIPGWVDLGLFAEYRFTHNFGFWAKGGNLLDQVVQRTPLVAEAGMYFTAGIVLNF
jgi:hypothetical protein